MKNFGEFSAVSGKSDGAINMTESNTVTGINENIHIGIDGDRDIDNYGGRE